jgi:hypothetical protein
VFCKWACDDWMEFAVEPVGRNWIAS